MSNSTGNTQAIGFHQVHCLGKSFSFFCSKSCSCRTNLFSNRIKEKIGPIGICLHKSELKHFLQAESEDVQAQLKQKWDSQQNGLIARRSPKLFKQNNVTPYAVGQLKGLLKKKKPKVCLINCVVYPLSKSLFFFVSSTKRGWDDMRSKSTLNKHFVLAFVQFEEQLIVNKA